MSNEKKTELLIVVCGGVFGIHKFIKGDIKMGLIYLCTAGLLGVGWIADIIKVLTGDRFPEIKFNSITEDKLPNIQVTNLNLANGETCCYMDKAYTFKEKTVTTGYTGGGSGFSIRLTKGLSYRIGGSKSKAIRETQTTIYNGIIYITTKRVIFTSEDKSFDKTFDKITSVQKTKDGIVMQIGANTYFIILKTNSKFMETFNVVKNINKQ
jgi:TM2 domain-containing membrane protein YozV